jgi:hypothetical protein
LLYCKVNVAVLQGKRCCMSSETIAGQCFQAV